MPITAFTKLYELIKSGKLLSLEGFRQFSALAVEILTWAKGLGIGSTPGVLRSTEVPTDDEAAAICQQLGATPHDAEAAIDLMTIYKLVSWLIATFGKNFGG